jgi:hypothetical protein
MTPRLICFLANTEKNERSNEKHKLDPEFCRSSFAPDLQNSAFEVYDLFVGVEFLACLYYSDDASKLLGVRG